MPITRFNPTELLDNGYLTLAASNHLPCVTSDRAIFSHDRLHCNTLSNHWHRVAAEQLKTIARMKRSLARQSRVAKDIGEELKDSPTGSGGYSAET
jgi:hypothetical protein